MLGTRDVVNFGKDGGPNNDEDLSNKILKILDLGPIPPETMTFYNSASRKYALPRPAPEMEINACNY